jgi:ADP-heptose:LPS heptosyltransferase
LRTDSIGDLILFSGALKAIREGLPGQHITLLVRDVCSELAAASGSIDTWHGFPLNEMCWVLEGKWSPGAFSAFYRLGRLLGSRRWDQVVHAQYNRTLIGDWVVRNSRAISKVGWKGRHPAYTERLWAKANQLYTDLIEGVDERLLETEKNALLVERVTGATRGRREVKPCLSIGDSSRMRVDRLLDQHGVPLPYAVLFPGSQYGIKCWPPARFADTATVLRDRYGLSVVVAGSNSENDLAASICSAAGHDVFNVTGQTTLMELGALMEGASLYVGNDTSGLHIAATVGIPTIAIMGGGHFGRFYPWGSPDRQRMVFYPMDCYYCAWKCRWAEPRCVTGITVADVVKELGELEKAGVLANATAAQTSARQLQASSHRCQRLKLGVRDLLKETA